jgi:hypothetical protein
MLVEFFNGFKIPTIVILGNHDMNLNNMHRIDAISPVLDVIQNSMITFIKENGLFELGGITYEYPIDTGTDDDVRIITADIDLVLRGNLYLPIKDANVIEHVYANIVTNKQVVTTIEEHAFDDDTVEINSNNSLNDVVIDDPQTP